MLILGRLASGGARIEGSIASVGVGLLITAVGGTNWRRAGFGSLPLLAGNGDRSPPPPPPCIRGFGTSTTASGRNTATVFLTAFCTGLVESASTTITTSATWTPNDMAKDFF